MAAARKRFSKFATKLQDSIDLLNLDTPKVEKATTILAKLIDEAEKWGVDSETKKPVKKGPVKLNKYMLFAKENR